METILKITEHPGLSSIFQIGLDILILALLAAFLVFKKQRLSKKDMGIIQSFEKIIAETGDISETFEKNLEDRKELIQQITARLDQRIQEAQTLCGRLETLINTGLEKSEKKFSEPVSPGSHNADRQKILSLANKGLNASEIAKAVRRPVGEIELILSLQRIS